MVILCSKIVKLGTHRKIKLGTHSVSFSNEITLTDNKVGISLDESGMQKIFYHNLFCRGRRRGMIRAIINVLI
jgi:hypothetical protein